MAFAASLAVAFGVEVGKGWRCQGRIFHKLERGFNDSVLTGRIVRRIERIAVVERHAQRAWWADALSYFAKQLDHHGRNPLPLQFRRDQAHGLIAHRSDGHEQRDIDRVFHEPARGFGRGLLDEPSGRGD